MNTDAAVRSSLATHDQTPTIGRVEDMARIGAGGRARAIPHLRLRDHLGNGLCITRPQSHERLYAHRHSRTSGHARDVRKRRTFRVERRRQHMRDMIDVSTQEP